MKFQDCFQEVNGEMMADKLKETKVTQLLTGWILTTPYLLCFRHVGATPGLQHLYKTWVIALIQLPSYCVTLGMSLRLLDVGLTGFYLSFGLPCKCQPTREACLLQFFQKSPTPVCPFLIPALFVSIVFILIRLTPHVHLSLSPPWKPHIELFCSQL